ncbi:hypothetical protein B0H12DRAFT_1093955 [Mycena haematopus]|nr:hypothetical protein B0H12DRAFT_1093955 [Mycena haematopus]
MLISQYAVAHVGRGLDRRGPESEFHCVRRRNRISDTKTRQGKKSDLKINAARRNRTSRSPHTLRMDLLDGSGLHGPG